MSNAPYDHILSSTTAGYYSYLTGARYVSPLVSGTAFPELVDMHESQHRSLAHSNMVDCIGRLFAETYKCGRDELAPVHKKLIGMLFETINEHSVQTHEFVATYTSFLDFARQDLIEVGRARAELAQLYDQILNRAEAAFGRIDDSRMRGNETGVIYSVIDCANAAMSPWMPPELIAFERIAELIKFIDQNSPDVRFFAIIDKVRPFWDSTGLLWGVPFRTNDEVELLCKSATQKRLHAKLPHVAFMVPSDYEGFALAALSALKADARAQGYGFLEDKAPIQPPPSSPIYWAGSQFVHPLLPTQSPIDLTLVQTQYLDGSLYDLESAVAAFQPDNGCVFLHVMPVDSYPAFDPSSEGRVYCFAVGKPIPSFPKPFVFTASFADIAEQISKLPRSSIVVKIDERAERPIATFLARTGHSIFVLLHNTRPIRVKEILSAAGQDQPVSIDFYELKGERFVILMAALEADGCVLLCPLTSLGLRVLSSELEAHSNAYMPPDQAAGLKRLKIDVNQLEALMRTTYVGRPQELRQEPK